MITKKIKKKTRAEAKTTKNTKTTPVLVCTEYRGVFFGYTAKFALGDQRLTNCRNVTYWSTDVSGFQGLAENGPTALCRVGALVAGPVLLSKVTYVAQCSSKAAQAWMCAACVGR
jgi:hypothetical protein